MAPALILLWVGRRRRRKKKEHEGHKKKKGNDNNNEDVHSFCEEEESKGNSEKKKKKKKRETSSEGEHQQLETKKKKKTKSKEQVDDNTTENDIPVKKKKKKKKKDKTLNDDQDCGEADDEENSFTVQCAPVCNFKSRRCSSGFGRSPISRLLSKMEVCDVCPGNVCHQKSDDPRPSETVNETTAVVVIKQERMQDWAGYINKDAQPDASVGNKEPEESPLSEKANGDGKLAGDEVHETSNGEININIKQEKLDSHRKESESVQNENDSLNISIKQEKHNSQEILPEESMPLQNGNDNIKQERNRSHEEENNVELENVVQNGEVLKQDNRDNYNTITTIENSSALNDTTFVNYYDDSFVYKDEFCNYSDPLADEEGNAIAQQGKDYLHSVITDNNYVRNLQCTISAQGEERRVTSVDGERHMLHFVNVYPKFRHKIQVSRILKVPLRLIYFHYYVTEGTKEFLDVYVKFNSQQNLKTAIQFYARRVRCENWCTKDENDLPEEVKEDVGNDHYPHEGHAAGYENPPRHRNEQWGRSYLHPNGRGRFNSQRGVHMGRRHLGASEIAQLAIANNA